LAVTVIKMNLPTAGGGVRESQFLVLAADHG
jgi:hypothetical protein